MDNLQSVIAQMEDFGVVFRDKDFPLEIPSKRQKTCGRGGKWWYWLQKFEPKAGGEYVVGTFGSYKTGERLKVEVNWEPLKEADRARLEAERKAAEARAAVIRREEADLAACSAAELWHRASPKGTSAYLDRKGVVGEACRYLPDGSILVPLLRYDYAREHALRACQRILPDGNKRFTKGLAKAGCCVRLGNAVDDSTRLVMVCEGYATGLTLRMATHHEIPVFVALDAGNLQHVVPLLRGLYPQARILVCADDDYRTRNQQTGELCNPGRTAAKAIAKQVTGCDFVWPVFAPATRQIKDTDFNDLHQRQGLEAVRRQLLAVVQAIRKQHG